MNSRFTITFEGDHVRVMSTGDRDYRLAQELWSRVAESCRRHDCFKVLGVADSATAVTRAEPYDHSSLFLELNIGHEYRIAWVELNPDKRNAVAFVETVMANRGLPARLFSTVVEAKEWLLGNG